MHANERPEAREAEPAESHRTAGDLEGRVLVLAPRAANSAVLCRLLGKAGIPNRACGDVEEAVHEAQRGAGAVLLTERALRTTTPARQRELLGDQPYWSDLPVVMLIEARQRGRLAVPDVRDILQETSVTLLEQPVRAFSLISAVRAALRARRRQYEVRDIHEDLEHRVEERTRQVRELASTLTMAEQKERRRIAHVLHDDLQQRLYGTRIKINLASSDIEAGREQLVREDLADAVAWLDQSIDLTRNLSSDLSPAILKSEGLTDTLDWLRIRMEELYGLEVEIVAEDALRTPQEDLRVLLFQIVRELLFNVVKHADTGRARVALRQLNDHVEIVVSDAGKGFDVEAVEARKADEAGFGLFSVGERLGLFGGHMDIESSPGTGTRVRIDVPLELA